MCKLLPEGDTTQALLIHVAINVCAVGSDRPVLYTRLVLVANSVPCRNSRDRVRRRSRLAGETSNDEGRSHGRVLRVH